MVKVRKLPVIVDAIQIDTEMYIDTLEGVMKASPGDWIVTGIDGEKYPVKPDIFEKTYEIIRGQILKVILFRLIYGFEIRKIQTP